MSGAIPVLIEVHHPMFECAKATCELNEKHKFGDGNKWVRVQWDILNK